jgi:general secretion pathway protein K
MTGVLKNNRGMALLLTILIISIIVVVTLQFNTTMRSDLQAAANLRDSVKLGYIASSAFSFARSILQADGLANDSDNLRESWAQTTLLSGFSTTILDEGRFELEITDHSGRLQVNSLVYAENAAVREQQYDLWYRFLLSEEFSLDTEEVEALLAALIDWLDEDDEKTGFGGAENFYYQTLEKPHTCRNGPMEFVEDLLYVKGMSRELFHGNGQYPGIRQFVTPHGIDGRININTASPVVLRALAEPIDNSLAEEMVVFREDGSSDLSNPMWYKDVPGFPGDVDIPASLLSVFSSFFSVQARAYIGTMSRTVSGVVMRDLGNTEVVSWKIE